MASPCPFPLVPWRPCSPAGCPPPPECTAPAAHIPHPAWVRTCSERGFSLPSGGAAPWLWRPDQTLCTLTKPPWNPVFLERAPVAYGADVPSLPAHGSASFVIVFAGGARGRILIVPTALRQGSEQRWPPCRHPWAMSEGKEPSWAPRGSHSAHGRAVKAAQKTLRVSWESAWGLTQPSLAVGRTCPGCSKPRTRSLCVTRVYPAGVPVGWRAGRSRPPPREGLLPSPSRAASGRHGCSGQDPGGQAQRLVFTPIEVVAQ